MDLWVVRRAVAAVGEQVAQCYQALGEALWSPIYAMVERPVNSARYLFLDRTAREMYPDWDLIANETAAIMRHTAGADPREPETLRTGRRTLDPQRRIPSSMGVARRPFPQHRHQANDAPARRRADPELRTVRPRSRERTTMFTYTAEPGTRSAEGLDLLASWAASPPASSTNRSHLDHADSRSAPARNDCSGP